MPLSRTRNFCIIAHIDHGKTTLSDRLLQKTGTVADREAQDQHLDAMDLERERGLTIIPVINKIDLPNSDIPTVKKQLEEILSIPSEEALLASAKAGIGIEEILEAVIERIPPPKKWADEKIRGLVFDSTFDTYRG